MLKRKSVIACILVALLALVALPAFAGQFQVESRTYWVDGKPYPMDAAPFTERGRTYVPLRYLALALGVAEKDIGWDAKSGTVTLKLGQTTVKLTVGKRTMYVNGKAEQMDVAPLVRGGRTYLPARWVAEAFGYEVKWEASSQKVILAYAGTTAPAAEPKPVPASPKTETKKKGEELKQQLAEWLARENPRSTCIRGRGFVTGDRLLEAWEAIKNGTYDFVADPASVEAIYIDRIDCRNLKIYEFKNMLGGSHLPEEDIEKFIEGGKLVGGIVIGYAKREGKKQAAFVGLPNYLPGGYFAGFGFNRVIF
jgi:hypothetical protein